MYLYDTWARFTDKARRTPLIWFGVLANVGILLIASVVMVGGTYGSVYVLRSLVSSLAIYAPRLLARIVQQRLMLSLFHAFAGSTSVTTTRPTAGGHGRALTTRARRERVGLIA